MSKIIYQPKGKAGEYAKYAANFFNGCPGRCTYCYNRTGRAAKVLGGDCPELKKSIGGFKNAMPLFRKELEQNLPELRERDVIQKHLDSLMEIRESKHFE